MSDLKKWRVTGPNGTTYIVEPREQNDYGALCEFWRTVRPMVSIILRDAGYRAEPIEEEPKMVTVRAEDLRRAIQFNQALINMDSMQRLCAALEEGK